MQYVSKQRCQLVCLYTIIFRVSCGPIWINLADSDHASVVASCRYNSTSFVLYSGKPMVLLGFGFCLTSIPCGLDIMDLTYVLFWCFVSLVFSFFGPNMAFWQSPKSGQVRCPRPRGPGERLLSSTKLGIATLHMCGI